MSYLGLDLGKWFFKQRPVLLVAREDDTVDALNAVAAVLGGLLATILLRTGEDAYKQTLSVLFSKVNDPTLKNSPFDPSERS